MTAKKLILTRLLPKTGQVISYLEGDDGDIQAGWWRGKGVANNKVRLIAKTINGDDVVIDRATGLMWAADGNGNGCYDGNSADWSYAIGKPSLFTLAGFTDWRLPNVRELCSIINYSLRLPSIDEPPFVNTVVGVYWTSTTYIGATTKAFYVDFAEGQCRYVEKTSSLYIRSVRGGL